MLVFPPVQMRNRRRSRRQSTEQPVALTLIEARLISRLDATAVVELVFNTTSAVPLVDVSAAAPAQWSAYVTGSVFEGTSLVQTAFDRVTLTMTNLDETEQPDSISYAASPSDIRDAAGRTLGAVVGMGLVE
ncbi:MAG: hypothetical protein QM770_15585 [Tepidisphaeraceae bacterium]